MSTALIPRPQSSVAEKVEQVVIGGDIGRLTSDERISYYKAVCDSVGLNPLTKPFEYITLNGKLTLYARKDCTDQLRTINNVSVVISAREVVDDCFVVTAQATTPGGRTDGSIGAVSIANLKGEARANAMMKAETKAKRRVTLSICGLGILDETEIETIPASRVKPADVPRTTEEEPIRSRGNVAPAVNETPAQAPMGEVASLNEKGDATATPEYIDTGMSVYLYRKARDAKKGWKDTDTRSWLLAKGYKGSDGLGGTEHIEKAMFDEIVAELLAFVRGQRP